MYDVKGGTEMEMEMEMVMVMVMERSETLCDALHRRIREEINQRNPANIKA